MSDLRALSQIAMTLVAVEDAVRQSEGALTTNDRAAARRHCARARRLLQQAMALTREEAVAMADIPK